MRYFHEDSAVILPAEVPPACLDVDCVLVFWKRLVLTTSMTRRIRLGTNGQHQSPSPSSLILVRRPQSCHAVPDVLRSMSEDAWGEILHSALWSSSSVMLDDEEGFCSRHEDVHAKWRQRQLLEINHTTLPQSDCVPWEKLEPPHRGLGSGSQGWKGGGNARYRWPGDVFHYPGGDMAWDTGIPYRFDRRKER